MRLEPNVKVCAINKMFAVPKNFVAYEISLQLGLEANAVVDR